ncbi:GNAT family N-acetyltransferase [Brachybacterium sp. P6-10-X1]|uniref:GNAT family N-acetyltransferase n=1 Tax=Brachybacterium sp. P6-10-X1 TaxID=1903186 RepID=UPI000971876E|nr:GNAT family protein [Brachybacterium sp. P6-10-X1]APX34163.1 GNAT family N-acetyltransferase [Brachybacterium sp. P6-10-X1]
MTLRLERLGPGHAPAILAGQDDALAEEIIGARWETEMLGEFLERAARWRDEGPIREYAAVLRSPPVAGGRLLGGGRLVGGGGLNLMAPGLARGQAALTYWLLAEHRGRRHGFELVRALVDRARSDVRIAQLVLRIAPRNEASRAVARRLGAISAGTRDRHPADASRLADRWVLDLR